MSVSSPLAHKTVFIDGGAVSVSLPLTPALRTFHADGSFPLLADPLKTKQASIVGMFVLRPAHEPAFTAPILNSHHHHHPQQQQQQQQAALSQSIYGAHDWCFNCRDLPGGWLIANRNAVDAYRLALQYGTSDAVIVGSRTVSDEGLDTEHGPGYMWQPYGPCCWPQVKSADPHMTEKIAELRSLWQSMGYLSSTRKYPAQIVFTWSGKHQGEGKNDFLAARVFHTKHPSGEAVESYIMTSELGAANIRARAHKFNLHDRIEDMLIIIPPHPALPPTDVLSTSTSNSYTAEYDMDLSLVPKLLFDKYDMRIVNHDGGHRVLMGFCKEGALCQMNITLGRKQSVQQVLRTIKSGPGLTEEVRERCVGSFDSQLAYFFSKPSVENEGRNRSIPSDLRIVYAIEDVAEEVAVVTFDVKEGYSFYDGDYIE